MKLRTIQAASLAAVLAVSMAARGATGEDGFKAPQHPLGCEHYRVFDGAKLVWRHADEAVGNSGYAAPLAAVILYPLGAAGAVLSGTFELLGIGHVVKHIQHGGPVPEECNEEE